MTSPSHGDCSIDKVDGSTIDKDLILGEIAFKRSKSSTYVPRIASAQYVNKYINMASIQKVIQEATLIETSLLGVGLMQNDR